MTARWGRIAAGLLCAALLTAALVRAEDATPVQDTAPVGIRANYFLPEYRTGSFRHMDRVFPFHMIYRAGPVSELPLAEHRLGEVTYQWKGTAHTLDDLHQMSKTTGFLVIKDGRIVQERYFGGASETSTFTSMSVAKSFTSTLVGLALADGKIKSLDDAITDYLPELKGSGYDGVPIKALLE